MELMFAYGIGGGFFGTLWFGLRTISRAGREWDETKQKTQPVTRF